MSLTDEQIMAIRVASAIGTPHKQLAAQYERCEDYINQIVRGKVRGDLPVIETPRSWHAARALATELEPQILALFHQGVLLKDMRVQLGLKTAKPIMTVLRRNKLSLFARRWGHEKTPPA